MMRVTILTGALLVATAPAAAQELPFCSPRVNSLGTTQGTGAPEGSTTVEVGRRDGTRVAAVSGAIGANWTESQVTGVRKAATDNQGAGLIWTTPAGTRCFQGLLLTGGAGGGTGSPLVGGVRVADAFEEDQCVQAGAEWLQRLVATPGRRRDRTTVLVFKEDVGLCWQSNDRPAQGDPIHVGVFTDTPTQWDTIRSDFQPCSLEPDSPAVLVSDRLPTFPPGRQSGGAWVLREYPVRRCWNTNVVVTVRGAESQFSHTLVQASRYRATLHLGTVFTENHETTFGLRPDGEVNRIFAQGPVDKGPEYVAALVFYSLLRYLPALGGGEAYQGRDVVRDNAFADKLGAVVGVGLRNPLKRFIAGASFEIAAGVNVLATWDWAEVSVLSGVREGDVFTGDEEDIPTQQEWRQKFVVGVSLDLVYATTAFRR